MCCIGNRFLILRALSKKKARFGVQMRNSHDLWLVSRRSYAIAMHLKDTNKIEMYVNS